VAADDTDAIVIGTWSYMHREISCAVLAAGKHVMCEARMAMNAAEAHAMLAASQAHPNLVAQIVPSPFTFRTDCTIQDLLADGYVGDLYTITVRGVTSSFADSNAPLHWRQGQELSGYNIMTMGIWYVEEEFIGAIRGQEELRLTTFADGVKYMEFTEAVHRSLTSGEVVSLPLTNVHT
jgi:predicted dehydrogenase